MFIYNSEAFIRELLLFYYIFDYSVPNWVSQIVIELKYKHLTKIFW